MKNLTKKNEEGLCTYQCKPRGREGGGGLVQARGGDLTNFKIF